jgi:teichoic acid ribitol-phosphate primase
MSVIEYRLSSLLLRVLGALFALFPRHPRRVVLATARVRVLDGNLRAIDEAIRRLRPDADVIRLLEPYGYGRAAKLRYLLRVIRGTYHVRTAGLVVVDNAWLPVHVAPHPGRTTVVQVWHATGALKRFGVDTAVPPIEPERTFLHRYYDYVVTAGEASRIPWAAALRTPVERVLPLGSPRTDDLLDPVRLAAARSRALAAHPSLAGRRVVLFAPTFRGRGPGKRDGNVLDGERLRALLPAMDALVLKTHPNLDPTAVRTAGYDVVAAPTDDMNDLLALADVLVTDYSSSVFEFALLRRPVVLVVPDLETYERDPGLYLDMRTELVGALVRETDAAAAAIRDALVDGPAYDAFIAHNLAGCDGHAAERFVERFVAASPAGE